MTESQRKAKLRRVVRSIGRAMKIYGSALEQMREMTIEINGRLVLADPPALLRYYRETPGVRCALICQRCKAICAIRLSDCDCCKNFGRSFGGSKRIRTMSPHDRVPVELVLEALLKALRRAAAL